MKHEFHTQNGFDATLTINSNPVYSDLRIMITSRMKSFSDLLISINTVGDDRGYSKLVVASQQLNQNQAFEFNQGCNDAHDLIVQYANLHQFVNDDHIGSLEKISEALKIRDFIFAATAISLYSDPEFIIHHHSEMNALIKSDKESATLMECVLHLLNEHNAQDVFYDEAQFFYRVLMDRIVSRKENKAKLTVLDLVEKVVKEGQSLIKVDFSGL